MATKLQVMVFALAFIGLIGSTLVVTRNEARAGSAHYQAQNMFVFGDPTDLVAGAATLTRTKKGIAYSVSTSELMPGANTIWIVIFNKPEHCAGGPGACVGSDLSTPTVLRERLAKTRWPDEVGNENWEYGTTLASLQELVTYWQTTYDWRQHERAMNAFQQYKVTIDGQPIHFIHEPGRSPRPMPLILTRVPISSVRHAAPTHVRLRAREGGPARHSVAKCEQITTLQRERLLPRALGGPLSAARMTEIKKAILRTIGMPV